MTTTTTATTTTTDATLEAIRYTREGGLELLDQTLLPLHFVYERIPTCEACHAAIRTMKVRGAPAIAIAAALSLAVEATALARAPAPTETAAAACAWVAERTALLATARPTAVNLHAACRDLCAVAARAAHAPGADAAAVRAAVVARAEAMLAEDARANAALSAAGAAHLAARVLPGVRAARGADARLRVLTHCNAGALATARHGTALGVVRALWRRGLLERVYCTETRPWNQGARLSTFEMAHEGVPVTLVCDSAVASLVRRGAVDAAVVGADRVCANGDTANKIGTYSVALACAAHGVPLCVAAPATTFDLAAPTGAAVPIEVRPRTEVTCFPGEAPPGHVHPAVDVWNPAFDITPAALVAAFFTDVGCIVPPDGADPAAAYPSLIPQVISAAASAPITPGTEDAEAEQEAGATP